MEERMGGGVGRVAIIMCVLSEEKGGTRFGRGKKRLERAAVAEDQA